MGGCRGGLCSLPLGVAALSDKMLHPRCALLQLPNPGVRAWGARLSHMGAERM